MQLLDSIVLAMAIFAVLVSFVSAPFAIYAFARVMALEKSTHKIEMVPVDSFVNEKKKEEEEEEDDEPRRLHPERPDDYPRI